MALETNAAEKNRNAQQWSGQFGFIISAIGSAVGLGNIWRFPGVAYTNGGGAFMIPYLVALLTAGIPILFLDYAIGHRFRGSPPLAFSRIKRWLESLGWFQVMICVFIAIYYAVILAWAASYFIFSFNLAWGDDTATFFTGSYLQNEPGVTLSFVPGVLIPLVVIWAAAIVILALGVNKGVEKANMVFIPLLCVAFLVLVVRAVFLPGAVDGLNALFTPDFSKLTDPSVWVAAYGQIFFSLSIAFGIMITYSSYRKRKSNQTSPGLVVGFANSSFELLAGIGVFAILGFMAGQQGTTVGQLEGLTGPTLSFITFPKVISMMPGGPLFGCLFFGSLLAAGFTSMISITQVISSAFQDKFLLSPRKSAVVTGVPLAIVSSLLFGVTSGLNVLDIVDNWANNVGIVFSAILMCTVLFWWYDRKDELAYHLSALSTFKVKTIWKIMLTFVSPILLVFMFVQSVGSLITGGYGGYDNWMIGVFGWGQTALSVVLAVVLTLVKWPFKTDDFQPWPVFDKKGALR